MRSCFSRAVKDRDDNLQTVGWGLGWRGEDLCPVYTMAIIKVKR